MFFALSVSGFVSAAGAVDVPLWVDFDNSENLTHSDYVGFQPQLYDASRGYGWSQAVGSRGYWSGEQFYNWRDFHYSASDATFRIDVPNGAYTLYLEILNSDRDYRAYDKMDVRINGTLRIDDLSPDKGVAAVKHFDVDVANGRIEIAFHDDGGQGSEWCIQGLRLMPRVARTIPQVSSVSGVVAAGAPLVISGQNFGSKSPAGPAVWDDFENGVNGDALDLHSEWIHYRSNGHPFYSSEQKYSGNLSAHNYIFFESNPVQPPPPTPTVAPGPRREFFTAMHRFPESEQVFVTYKFRYEATGDAYGVRKLTRVTSRGDGFANNYNGEGTLELGNSSNGCNTPGCMIGYAADMDRGSDTINGFSYLGMATFSWNRIDMYAKLSAPGARDGRIQYARNSQLHWFDEHIMTRTAGSDFRFWSSILGLMLANPRNDGMHKMYIDDFYLDTTQRRVEICNVSSWERVQDYGALCEPQVASSWSNSSITVNLNRGALNLSGDLFLYVIGEDGSGSNAYALAPNAAPAAPANLRME